MRLLTCTSSIEAALDNVINLESQVKTFPIENSVSISISNSRKHISITILGIEFLGYLNNKLIHQLGSKIWPNLSMGQVVKLWNEHVDGNLKNLLEIGLSKSRSIIRYIDAGGSRHIYGITSSTFVEVNQGSFRVDLVKSMSQLGITPNKKVFNTPFGEVVEEFSVPGAAGQVGLSCKVVYGLNNGYSSYRLNWGRIVLICTNGLTAFEKNGQDRWIHTNESSISNFVTTSVEGAYNHLSVVEKQILAARDRSINQSLFDKFMTRLALPSATKERVSARLIHESSDTGPNDWSMIQALTFLGQHERAIPFRVQDDLTRLGSILLEKSLEEVILAPAVITPSGFYDILR